MKKIKFACLALSMLGVVAALSGCDSKEKVVIWTSTEEYNKALMREKFAEQFPNYNVVVEHVGTSTIGQKIIEEKDSSACDIVFCEEYGWMEKIIAAGGLDSIQGDYDISRYEDFAVPASVNKYVLPCLMTGGCVAINTHVLEERGLAKPTSYSDLLLPEYKDLVSMADPTQSGTGYMFYYSIIKELGEGPGIAYFQALKENVLSFESSGSKPVNRLIGREVAVAFGMISQVVNEINEGNEEIEILFFEPGAPYNLYGNGIVKGKKARSVVIDGETHYPVKEVMDYLDSYYTNESCSRYYPEPVFKNTQYSVENYPTNIQYCNMEGSASRKDHLNTVWTETVIGGESNI